MLFKCLNFHIQKKLKLVLSLLFLKFVHMPYFQTGIAYGLPTPTISKSSVVLAMHGGGSAWLCPGCCLLRSLLASDPSLPHTVCRPFSNLLSRNCTSKGACHLRTRQSLLLALQQTQHHKISPPFQFDQIKVHTS